MTSKRLTIADPQLLSGSGDITRDALGLSIDGGIISDLIQEYDYSEATEDEDEIKKKYIYNMRLIGSEQILNDKQWLSYVNGGEYSDTSYPGIFADLTFFDHHHNENTPYTEKEVRENGTYSTQSPTFVSCKPQVNNYFRLYEESIRNLSDVKVLPNGYKLLHNGSMITEQFKLGSVEVRQTASLLENIFVTNEDIYDEIEATNNRSDLLPYYVKTSFDFESTGHFIHAIEENIFEHRFIKILKDSFLSQDGATDPLDVTFTVQAQAIDNSKELNSVTSNVELKVVDVFDMLNYSLLDYNTEDSNFDYLYDNSEAATSQYNNNSIRRFEKTLPTIKQTNSLLGLLNGPIFKNTFFDSPLESQEKYNEVVAYRIEKIGGQVSGDSLTQNTLQNFWFLNTDGVERFDFIDNQIFFNQDYTYRIYKYVLVAGIEYSYSDLAVTRTIADLDSDGITDSAGWCLEFFDPATGDSSAPVFGDGTGGVENITNTLSSDAQVQSQNKYLADFRLTVRPSVKIVEVPIVTKEVSIVDSFPNSVQIRPTFLLDNSNTLQFFVRYDTKVPALFPTPVTTADADYKQRFMNSYDLIESDLVAGESGTLPLTLEVYRLKEMPRSVADFDGSLLMSKSMKVLNHDATYSATVCFDKVTPNTKYYYMFRIVNEAGNAGLNSNIIEAELVSDGGYKFANFESYFENELKERALSRTLKGFKKLIGISPTIENLIVDDSMVDYSDLAKNQINNITFGQSDNPVWEKKFKIRLTSKKTGKKIDINITHKLVG
jgi:hypothetical protein